MTISVGVMAYNEGQNIASLLESLVKQNLETITISEIIVVSSECRDQTDCIVREFERKDSRIKLLTQGQREGKASAINLFISNAKCDIVVLANADTIPDADAVERLVAPLIDLKVGMTGGRPVSVYGQNGFVGYTVNLMWNLHHVISLATPKMGELVAFRSMLKRIPEDTAVDEANIEAIVKEVGYELRYVPEAVVRNNGPETFRDFIKQRRRIAAGHRHLLKETGYKVSTLSPVRILRELWREHTWGVKETAWTLGAIGLEALSRFLGWWDFCVRKRNPYIWDVAASTKSLVPDDRNGR